MSLNKQQVKNHYLEKIRKNGLVHITEIFPEYRRAVSELVSKGLCNFENGYYVAPGNKK